MRAFLFNQNWTGMAQFLVRTGREMRDRETKSVNAGLRWRHHTNLR